MHSVRYRSRYASTRAWTFLRGAEPSAARNECRATLSGDSRVWEAALMRELGRSALPPMSSWGRFLAARPGRRGAVSGTGREPVLLCRAHLLRFPHRATRHWMSTAPNQALHSTEARRASWAIGQSLAGLRE